MLNRQAAKRIDTHEDLFIERYRWLMDWAFRLTGNDRQQAEDLVHDAFVHFIISRPSLERIRQNVDGYLYTMLKNLHVSEFRRATRMRESVTPLSEFSLTDYDSVESGLRVLEELTNAQVQTQIRDQLRRLCHYACVRKASSKAGSVLLLRFFHGYYPEEISRILRTSRQAVEDRLRTARTEARVFLEDPASLSFMSGRISSPPSKASLTKPTEDFIEELRREIYGSREGVCVSRKEIERLYAKGQSTTIDQQTLSHFVSCAECLDTVNTVLGLPLLADRFPIKTMSKDSRKQSKDEGDGPGGAAGSGGGEDDLLQKVRRKAKDLLNQRPLELRISVNGFILGSQSITSRVNHQTISVKGEERIGFVEVFSEKEVRLLFSCVEPPPDGPIEHKERVTLSDGRSLELLLDFSNATPDLHVTYTDPMLGSELSESVEAEDATARAEVFDSPKRHGGTGTLEPLKRAIQNTVGLLANWRFWLRPGTVTALLALILISALLLIYRRAPSPVLTATDLLQRSSMAEDAIAATREQVVHRALQLEEKSQSGQLIARRRIEVWQSADRGIIARRLYDENGVLLAGDWRTSNGVQTLYHHGAKPQLQLNPEKRQSTTAPLDFDQVWQFEPSAKDFKSLIVDAAGSVVEDKGATYLISFEGAGHQAGIVKAALTINKADLRATELSLFIRSQPNPDAHNANQQSGSGNPEWHEFHFNESAFERRAPSAVAPNVFEPDAELMSSKEAAAKIPKAETETVTPAATSPPTPAVATPELELQAAYLLDQVKANLGEQISLTRTRGGILRVEGIVETPERKAEIMRALAPLSNNPAVALDVSTVAEASKRQPQQAATSSVTVDRVEIQKGAIPLDAELRRYFTAQGVPADRVDEEIRQFGNRMIARARQAQMHGRVVKSLFERFTADELRALDAESRNKRLAMIREHAEAFRQETSRLRQGLEAVFFQSRPGERGDVAEITNEQDLQRAVERLFELGTAHENAMYSSFSISSEGASTSVVKTPQFWQSLRSSERLADEIRQATTKVQRHED